MCATCGCTDEGYRIDGLVPHPHEVGAGRGDGHPHPHPHDAGAARGHGQPPGADAGPGHGHAPGTDGAAGRTVLLEEKVLARNDALAAENRAWLRQRRVLAVNLMSSPGAGKTTLLERTVRELAGRPVVGVIEGDQETALDAGRIRAAGGPVVQINTGAGCHLDAGMVARALHSLDPPAGSVVLIENVGNLVCPALFDLGEAARVVLASVTEGADKPAKYPQMFRRADLVLVTKTDLLPYLDFDTGAFRTGLRQAGPRARRQDVSARTGEGMPAWYAWLRERAAAAAG